jgi:hypothetical protein
MNARTPLTVFGLLSILLAMTAPSNADVPLQEFRAGAYRGVVHLTTSVEGVGKTKASLKVKGRSTGGPTLQLIGTPQLAGEVVGITDDLIMKVFRIEPQLSAEPVMILSELSNMDADGSTRGRRLDSLTVGNNMVRAELNYERTLGVTTIAFTIRVVLTRVGP